MSVANRASVTATGCSLVAATTITLDSAAGFDYRDSLFNLIIVPEGVGTGTLTLEWASGDFETTFSAAYDDFGVAVTVDLADAISVVEIRDIDLYKLKLTPSGTGGGITGYGYSLVAVGT